MNVFMGTTLYVDWAMLNSYVAKCQRIALVIGFIPFLCGLSQDIDRIFICLVENYIWVN